MKGFRPLYKPHVSLIAFSYKTVQSILVHRVETKKTSLYTKWMALCDTSFFSLDSIIVSNIVPEPYSPQTGSFAGSRQEEPYCAEAEWKRKWRSIVEFLLSCTLYSLSLKNMVLFPHLISSGGSEAKELLNMCQPRPWILQAIVQTALCSCAESVAFVPGVWLVWFPMQE